MAIESNSASTSFGLLPELETRSLSFTVSMAANFLAAATVVFIAMSGIHEHVEIPQFDASAFVFPAAEPPSPKSQPKQVETRVPEATTKAERPRFLRERSGLESRMDHSVADLASVRMPDLPAALPKAVRQLPASANGSTLVTNPKRVSVGSFVSGDPAGVVSNPNANHLPTVPTIGSFHDAQVVGHGNSAQPSGSVSTVAFNTGLAGGGNAAGSAGGSDSAGGSFGSQHGSVGGTNFNSAAPVAGSGQFAGTPKSSSFVSPIVVFEPHPRYTTEARRLRIQGEVVYQVRLAASGKIELLRMINGLGHGLDEEAAAVIRHIQFQPAFKDGQPVDQVTLIHVAFRLA